MPEVRHDGIENGSSMRLVWATFAQGAVTLPRMDPSITKLLRPATDACGAF